MSTFNFLLDKVYPFTFKFAQLILKCLTWQIIPSCNNFQSPKEMHIQPHKLIELYPEIIQQIKIKRLL